MGWLTSFTSWIDTVVVTYIMSTNRTIIFRKLLLLFGSNDVSWETQFKAPTAVITSKSYPPRLMHRNWHINSHCLYQWKWLTRLVSRLKNRSRSSREIISKRSSANASGRSSNLSSRPSTQLLSKKTSLRSATTNRVLSFGSFWSIVPLSNSLPRNFLEAW